MWWRLGEAGPLLDGVGLVGAGLETWSVYLEAGVFTFFRTILVLLL